MRRLLVLLVVAIAGGVTSVALGASPHFVTGPTVSKGTNAVTVTAKVAGLGNVPTADFTLSGTATANYGCFNKGGNHPSATNKEGPSTISVPGTFPVRNGSTTVRLTLELPASTLSCPPGQHTELMSGSITGLTFSGMGLTADLGDITFP